MSFIQTYNITISSSPVTYTVALGDIMTNDYAIIGTHALAGVVTIDLPVVGSQCVGFDIYYGATLTNYDAAGATYLVIEGTRMPNEYAAKKCIIRCQYVDAAWRVYFLPDLSQSGIINSSNIVDGTIVAGDLASNAITTIKVTDGNITLPKIATQADNTILGNVSGGAASPIALTATQVRTLLDQDVTLTGNVTGTATQTAATGVTTVSTTIASNVITVAMCTNTVNTDLLTVPLGFQVAGLTGYVPIKVPYDCTVEEWGFSVTEDISAGDCVLTLYNNAGTLMGTSTVTVTGGTTIAGAAPATAGFFNSSSITSNNSMTAGQLITIKYVKATGVGGRGFANIKIKRA